ncbi:hypothetical protein Tco_0006518 [Tanacetum coccineum]
MTTSNRSKITRDSVAREIRVLVLGSYETALKHDAYLSLYKHQVTATSKASAGLSMILNGGAFDCVLVDSDECDMNLNYFVHQSSKLLPDLKIILMAPNNMPKEMLEIALYYKAVWLRVKPCGLEGISNVFEHIINRKMELLKKETDSRSTKRKKYSNFPNRIEGWNPRGKEKAYPHTIPEQMNVPGLSRNHIASHPQVDIERGRLMREPVILLPEKTNQNLNIQNYARQILGLSIPSHYDASTFQSNSLLRPSNLNSIGSLTMHVDSIRSKLQQNSSSFFPVLTAATCGSQPQDHSYIDQLHQAPGETSKRSALGLDEKPPRGMAQGSQVELQDQDYRKEIDMVTGENYSLPDFGEVMAPLDVEATVESQYNLGADANCASGSGIFKAPATSIVGANVTSQYNLGANGNLFSNGFGNSNSGGASGSGIFEAPATFVVGENVESQYNLRANANVYFNGFDNSNSGGDNGTEISATFVVGAIVESQYNLGTNPNVFSNCFDNSNSGGASGSGLSEQLANVDVFGIPIESHTTATDGVSSPSNGGLEVLALPVLNSSELGGDFHPQENVDNSQTLRLPVLAGEEKYVNNAWLNNMLETDFIISMGNYNENNDVFSYDP